MRVSPEQLVQFLEKWGMADEARNLYEKRYKKLLKARAPKDIDAWIKDRRDPTRFAQDLQLSWFVQDLFRIWLEHKLQKVDPHIGVGDFGTNANRVVKPGRKGITTRPDYIIRLADGRTKTVSFRFSTKERRKEGYDIKDSELNSMRNYDAVVLFAILPARKFFIVKDPDWIAQFPIRVHQRWGKPVYTIPADAVRYYDADEDIALTDIF